MSREILRDRDGYQIGWVETDATGNQVLRDKDGYRRGGYSRSDNTTRDEFGNRVGTGNLLVTLLPH